MGRKTSMINNVEEATIKLSIWDKVAYAIGDFGNNFSFSFIASFLLYFWTDILGIGPAFAGIFMGVSRVWDAINDPIIGRLSDQTDTKWGRYRPWIIRFTIPLAIMTVICFTDFGFESKTLTTIVAIGAYMILVLIYTCVNIPYSAMSASLTLDSDERGKIATFRLFFAYCSAMLLAYTTQRWVLQFGGNNPAKGYFWTAVMYMVIMLICHLICFFNTKEVVQAPVEKISYADSFKSLKGNWPVISISMGFLVSGLFTTGRSAVALYYFQYVKGDALYFATYSLLYMGCSMLGVMSAPMIMKRVAGKRQVCQIGYILAGVCSIGNFFIDNITLIYVINALAGIGCGMATSTIFGMVPDITEYTQVKYGMRAAGFISAFVNFWNKVGTALAPSIALVTMEAFGYVAGAQQSTSVLMAITALFTVIPGILSLVTALILKTYKLDRNTYNDILNSLKMGTEE